MASDASASGSGTLSVPQAPSSTNVVPTTFSTTSFPPVPETLTDPATEFVFTKNGTTVTSSSVATSPAATSLVAPSPSTTTTVEPSGITVTATDNLAPSQVVDSGVNSLSYPATSARSTETRSVAPTATSSAASSTAVVTTAPSASVVRSPSFTIEYNPVATDTLVTSSPDPLPATFSLSSDRLSHATTASSTVPAKSSADTTSSGKRSTSSLVANHDFTPASSAVSRSVKAAASLSKSTSTSSQAHVAVAQSATKYSGPPSSTAASTKSGVPPEFSESLDLGSSVTISSSTEQVTPTTFVTDGKTLTGSEAMAALAAATASSSSVISSTTKDKPSTLSSFTIVGIVGGTLVSIIIVYVVWYQWRKKRRDRALGQDGANDDDEKREDRRSTRSSFGNDPFDDGHTAYTETLYRPQTGYTEYQDDRQTGKWDDDLARELEYLEDKDDERGRRGLSTYQGGLTAALMDDGATTVYGRGPKDRDGRGARQSYMTEPQTADLVVAAQTADPFDPRPVPVPVPRGASGRYSDPYNLSSRPETRMMTDSGSMPATRVPSARPDSYTYGSIYDGYANSRASTRYGDEPATSTLLPWMRGDGSSSVPPVPPVPPVPAAQRTVQRQPRRQVQRRRSPPAAVMAQTPRPSGDDPWASGAIPSFR